MGHDINDPMIARAILDSYASRVGNELIERTGDADCDAAMLFALDAVILSHDGGEDPHFVYANQAAADLWRMPVSELIGMPSRFSAPPEHQVSRASMLKDAADAGVLTDYAGERVAKDGTRFVIRDATLWTVDYPSAPGQAVVFRSWELVTEGG